MDVVWMSKRCRVLTGFKLIFKVKFMVLYRLFLIKIGQLNQLEKVLDAFENIFIKKKKKKLKIFYYAN